MKKPFILSLLLVATVVACGSVPVEAMRGDTDCYEFTALNADVGKSTFSASGIRATADTNCPKIASVHIDVFDDANDNGVFDPGETRYSFADGQADPPSTTVQTGSLSGGKATNRGGTTWHATITNESGGVTSHGGSF
jgi:hypothetical protein